MVLAGHQCIVALLRYLSGIVRVTAKRHQIRDRRIPGPIGGVRLVSKHGRGADNTLQYVGCPGTAAAELLAGGSTATARAAA